VVVGFEGFDAGGVTTGEVGGLLVGVLEGGVVVVGAAAFELEPPERELLQPVARPRTKARLAPSRRFVIEPPRRAASDRGYLLVSPHRPVFVQPIPGRAPKGRATSQAVRGP
jgi:hypothetical protein